MKNRTIFVALFIGLILVPITVNTAEWQVYKTEYTIVKYIDDRDLQKFDRAIDYPSMFFKKYPLDVKTDKIFLRIQEILGMTNNKITININIYSNKKQLKILFLKQKGKALKIPRAWYVHANKTIYLNAKDINARILAHEMAHAIINSYLLVKPPRLTAEILARYVDKHLYF